MEDYIEIINKIKSLNLKDYPIDDLKKYLKQLPSSFKTFPIFKHTLPKGKKIIRARINNPGERFDNVSELSYKPKECNTTYQRASTPNNTMFYGAVTPYTIEHGENELERFTVLLELAYSSDFLKDDESKGKIKITFSRWEVTEDIHLFVIHPDESSLKKSHDYIKCSKKEYLRILKNSNLKEDKKNHYIEFSKFLSKEFSKKEIAGDYDYLVSAVFSELMCENGYDGAYYPSVRMDGDGINVAIKTTSVESKMVFKGASKHTFSKYKKDITEQPKYYYRSKLLENGRLQYNKVERFPTVYVKQTGYKLPFDPHTPQIYKGLFFKNSRIPEVHKKAVESFFKMRLKGYTELKEYCLTIEKCEGSLWVEGERMD